MADVMEPLVLSRSEPSEPKAGILLVDDNPANLLSLRAILEDLGQNLVEARSGEEAIQRVQSHEFAVVLLDVLMPGIGGFETARAIRSDERSRHTPIIFLTASDIDRSQTEEAYRLGAVDFLVKPLLPVALQSKVRGFVELFLDKQRARHEADQLRLLVHGTADYAIFMLDPNGHVVTWNAGAERLKGYKADEIIGQHFSRFYPQEALDRGWPAHELKVAAAEGRFEDEGWRVRKDGSLFWANVVITALRDDRGRLLGYSKITRDLTERKQAEENLLRSEERFRLLVEGAKDYAIFMLDPQGHIVSWNPGAERIKGYTAQEIIGQHFSKFYPQEALDRGWPAHELKVAAAEGRFEDEGWRVRKDGSQFWANVVITALHDEAGSFVGFSKITRDLTERKKSEENARRLAEETAARQVTHQERERLRVTLASIGDAVISTDAEGRVDFLNPVAQELVGWKTEEAASRTLEDVFRIVNEDTRQQVENPALRALKDGVIVGLANHTVLIARDGQERPIDDSAAPIRDAGGNVVGSVLVFRDISERKRSEAALNERVRLLTLNAAVGTALVQADQLRPMLQRCAEALVDHLHGAFARIWTLNPQGDVLELQASAGLYTHLDGPHSRVPVGQYKIGLIAQERRPHLTNAVAVDPRVSDQGWAQREGMVAFAGYPLLVDDRLVGVMAMFARQPLSDATVEAMASVANGIAVGVERKVAEEERRRQQEWLRVTLASIGDAMIATDTHGRVTFLNGVAQELTGWTQVDAEGQPLEAVFNILNEQTRQPVENPVERVLRDGVVVGLGNHTVLIARDGTERPIDDSAAPIKDATGSTAGVVLVFRDVTGQRQAEMEVRESEARKSAILETALDCIITMDHEGKAVEFNPAAEKTFGYSRADVIGRQLADFIIPPLLRERHYQGMSHYLATGEGPVLGKRLELPALRADGTEFPVELTITRISMDGPPLFTAYLRDITERIQGEAALRESEEKLRLLADTIPQLAWMARPDGHIFWYNRRWYEYTGTTPAQMEGWGWQSVHQPDTLPRVLERWKGSIASGDPFDMVFPLKGADAQFRPFLTRVNPLRNADGRILYWFGTNTDISEIKQMEAALGASEQRFRGLMEQAPFSIQVFAPDGRTLRVNRAWEELWGVTLGQIADYNILDDPQLEAKGVSPYIRRAFGGEPVEIPAIQYDPNQTIPDRTRHQDPLRWVSAVAYPLKDDAGRVREVVLVHQDITARKRAEGALREVEARFTAILNHSPSCIFAKDRQGRYLLANKALGEFTGRDAADLLGRTDADIFPAEVAARFARDDGDLLASGSPRIYEESFPHADTTVTALTVKFPLVGADGTPYAVCGIATDISDRKRAQDALRESERRWRSLAEALPNLVWTDLPDGQCDYLSSQWATYTGIPVNELLGLTWLERVIHPDDRERTAALWQAACEDKADYDLEYRIRRHDGQYHWFKTRGVPIRDEQGGIVKWFGTCTDIEDQKQAHEALARSEERFRQLADAMPQIVWTARPDGNIDYLNRQWHEFTGLSETLGNEGWAQILHPDDAPPAQERWAASVQSGARFEMEIRLLDRRRQTYRWHLIRTVAVHDGAGSVVRWFGTGTDIHEQKRAEESSRYLAEASATLAGVVDYESTLQKVANLAVPYFADWSAVDVANDDGSLRRLAVAHQDADKIRLAHELMRDYPPDPDAPGGAVAVLRTGKSEIVAEITDDMLVQGAKDERHLHLIRSLGLKSYICVPLFVSGNPLGVLTFATAESGRTYTGADLALANDLAHRAGVAIENTQLYQALREADRRKDEFLATLAHELRNPLAPIRNSLQILKMPRVDAATVERSRDMMERQVHHLVRLVDDLLDVSRVMRGKIELRRERVELATVVARAVETVQPLVDAQGHELSVRLPSESLPIDADPVRLAQVVGNLLTNAAKYTEPNGRIWLTAERQGDVAVLRVRDTGIGIAPDMLPRIFELFVQVDHAATRSQGGLGIGLTLVKNLVEMHNGTVQARSEGLDRGSEFVVRLPISAQGLDQDQGRETGQQAQEPPSPSGHLLLVVDDNQDAANSLAMLLKLQGHEVRVAYSGTAALEMTKTYLPDLVFLDIGMPGMDGYEVARRLRRQPGLENVVLAALTGWGQQEDRRRTAEAGFNHHLVKPPEPKVLEELLASLAGCR